MNFIAICLHCLDMRDFHSHMRDTPFLDELKSRSIYIPMGRGQGHNQSDSLNAELTGTWTARYCDSRLTGQGFRKAERYGLSTTVIEYLEQGGYDIFTCIGFCPDNMGTAAASIGMKKSWLRDEPHRLGQFNAPARMGRQAFIEHVKRSAKFYAHVFLRETHRPWGQNEGLCALVGRPPADGWPADAFCARKAALERPDEFSALRRRGLARADRIVEEIFRATETREDVTYIVYSNHGEVFDHFRHHLPYRNTGDNMIEGTSHGPLPYEVLYANMQMWVIPGFEPRVMGGVGRSLDFAPTVLELAGVSHPPMDGESMVPFIADGRFPARDRYAEGGAARCISMVRGDGMKLLSTGLVAEQPGERHGPDFHRLAVFDLTCDPYEYVNLIDTPRGREVLAWAIDRHRDLSGSALG